MTCEQIAFTVSALGVILAGVNLALDGVTIAHRRLQFRNLSWRVAWWAAWLSFFLGIARAAFFCGSPPS